MTSIAFFKATQIKRNESNLQSLTKVLNHQKPFQKKGIKITAVLAPPSNPSGGPKDPDIVKLRLPICEI